MRVSITAAVPRPGISLRRLRGIVESALRHERVAAGTGVSIVLVDDATIRLLNRRFLRKDRATDVLSFPLSGGLPRTQAERAVRGPVGERRRTASKDLHRLLGEIVISMDRARDQAGSAGHPLRTEVALLAVHGVLHLTGYDDRSPAQAAAMDRRQREILTALGEDVTS